MRVLKPKILFFLALVLLPLRSFADLSSEIGVLVSNEKINDFLSGISGDFNVKDKEITFSGGGVFKEIKKSRALISLDAEISLELEESSRILASVKFREFRFSLEDFYYKNITNIRRSGIRARVKTEISCPVLSVVLKNWSGTLSTGVSFDGETLRLEKENGEMDLKGSEIDIDLSSCKAPKGVSLLFKKEIIKWINSSEGQDLLFKQSVSFGQKVADKSWDKIKKEALSFELLNRNVEVELKEIKFLKAHIEAKGILKILDEKKDYLLKLEESDIKNIRTEAGAVLPKGFFSKLVPEVISGARLSFLIERDEIPGVDFLFNSRLVQFFVWSDLLNFKKNTNFKARISLKDADLSLSKKATNGFSYDFSGGHSVDMTFLNSNRYEFPYMVFKGQIKGAFDLSLTDEGFSIKVNNPSLGAKSGWHSFMKFWRKSKTKGKPWMGVIIPRVEKAFKGKSFDYSWEQMGLGSFIEGVSLEHLKSSTVLNIGLNMGLKTGKTENTE